MHKVSLYFWKLDELWGFIPRKLQKIKEKENKNPVFDTTPSMKFPFNSCQQNPPFFGTLKCLSLDSNPLIKGFKLSYNWILFWKLRIYVIQPPSCIFLPVTLLRVSLVEDWSSSLNFFNKTVPHASTCCSHVGFYQALLKRLLIHWKISIFIVVSSV